MRLEYLANGRSGRTPTASSGRGGNGGHRAHHGHHPAGGAGLLRPKVGSALGEAGHEARRSEEARGRPQENGDGRKEENGGAEAGDEEEAGCVVASPYSSASSGGCLPAPRSSAARSRIASGPTFTSRTARCFR